MAAHECGKIFLILLTTLMLLLTVALGFLQNTGLLDDLFLSDTGTTSDKYNLEVTPASETFLIWSVIYVAQIVWISYGLSTICRKFQGDYMYQTPGHLPPGLYVCYFLALACAFSWTFIWDREYLEAAFGLILGSLFFALLTLGLSFKRINRYADDLILDKKKGDIIATILLVHNGVGILAAWLAVATVLGLGIMLQYVFHLDAELVGSICLAAVGGEIVIWTILNHFVLEKYLRYLFTPNIVFIVGLVGIIFENIDLPKRNSILMVALLVVAGLAFFVKIGLSVYYTYRSPLYLRVGEDKHTHYVTTIALK